MAKSSLQYIFAQNQVTTDLSYNKNTNKDVVVLPQPLRTFVESIIREHSIRERGGYSLSVSQIPLFDKQLLLSYVVDTSEYEDAMESPYRLDAYLKEYYDAMQSLIDNHIDDVWHEDMSESGLKLHHYKDNGELYYRRG